MPLRDEVTPPLAAAAALTFLARAICAGQKMVLVWEIAGAVLPSKAIPASGLAVGMAATEVAARAMAATIEANFMLAVGWVFELLG